MTSNSVRKLVANAQFKWLFAGNTTMFLGFFATLLLRSLLAWELTNDELTLAYVNFVAAIFMFASSLLSGALIDHFERRRILVIAQITVFCAESFILFLLVTEQINIYFLFVSAIASSMAFPFIMPVRTAILVEAVGKFHLAKATAFLSTGMNLARMVSPAVIGFMADYTGFVSCYCLLLVFHALSLLCTFCLNAYPSTNTTRESFMKETFQGFGYIVKHRSLGLCILFGMLPLLITTPLQNLMIVFIEELWAKGGSGLGVMMAAMGLGGVVGSLGITLLKEGQMVKPLVYSVLIMTLFLFLFAFSPYFWLGVVAVLGIFSASMYTNTLVNTAVQLMSDDHIRGRVTAITLMSISLSPLGTVPLAFATKHMGTTWSVAISAAILAVAVFIIWVLSPSFRKIDDVSDGVDG